MEKQLKYKNGIINYKISGEGNTLVLLHGFIGSLEGWNYFSRELSKDFQVVCIDLPGHGRTTVFGEVHTMDFMSDCVNEVLVNEQIDNCVMIGHSMGGYATLAYAENYPDKLIGFGLFHSHASPDSTQKKKDRDQAIRIASKRPELLISEMLPKLFANEDISPYPDEACQLSSAANDMPWEGITAALAGMRDREDKQHVLQFSNVPILYILGEKDPVINYLDCKSQMESNDLIVPCLLPNAGHMGFIEDKIRTLQVVKEFVLACFP